MIPLQAMSRVNSEVTKLHEARSYVKQMINNGGPIRAILSSLI